VSPSFYVRPFLPKEAERNAAVPLGVVLSITFDRENERQMRSKNTRLNTLALVGIAFIASLAQIWMLFDGSLNYTMVLVDTEDQPFRRIRVKLNGSYCLHRAT
jgi:hypothetical protein